MTKQYCVRGHDTFEVGRVQRMCRECRRIGDRARASAERNAAANRRYHARGYLQRLNRMVDQAKQKWEAIFGSR